MTVGTLRVTVLAVADESTMRPTVASWITPKARKCVPSLIEGRGVHALESIAAGEVVAVKGGHIVDQATVESLPNFDPQL